MRKASLSLVLVAVAAVVVWLAVRSCQPKPALVLNPPVPAETVQVSTGLPSVDVVALPAPATPVNPPVKAAKPKAVAPELLPPPVKLHKELIPKNIEIVRVYYANMISGPGSLIQFDINGTGFTAEFQKMITVESGNPEVQVRGLSLMTPNQIRGTLVISENTATGVSFPRVLIQGKPVFQAPDPFAVIRPGEVLNLMFTEMGESGRSGRFRVFTNLTEETFQQFRVEASTPAIMVGDLTPRLPFVVDGTIQIGPAVGGDYGMRIFLGGKTIWSRDGIVRVVKPNIGETGLLQKIMPLDGYHRPGDLVLFIIQGSGFRPDDTSILQARVPTWEKVEATFKYMAPGRLDLGVVVPAGAEEKVYGLEIYNGSEKLMDLPEAFQIVPANWTRGLKTEPALVAGGLAEVILIGRELDKDFVSRIKVEVDEPELRIGSFEWRNPEEARAKISAGNKVKPGDYLLKMTSGGKPVQPKSGSIVEVKPAPKKP